MKYILILLLLIFLKSQDLLAITFKDFLDETNIASEEDLQFPEEILQSNDEAVQLILHQQEKGSK